eukprot:g22447.t1
MINKTPTQQNTSDCGIFVLAYAERIAMGLPVRSVDGSPSGINHKADWISYSDQADLPMSKKWREEMQAKLASIDTEKLTPEQKKKFKALWRRDLQLGRCQCSAGGRASISNSEGANAARAAELRDLRMRRMLSI